MPSFTITSNGSSIIVEADNITRAVETAMPSLGYGDKPDFMLANVWENGMRGYWVSPASLFNDYYVTAKAVEV